MVQILEGKPSFGQSIGASLGSGIGAGFNKAAEFAQAMQAEAFKHKLKTKSFEDLRKFREQRREPRFQESMNNQEGTVAPEGLDMGIQQQAGNPYEDVEDAIAAGLPKEYITMLTQQAKSEQKKADLPREQYIKQEYKSLPKFMEAVDAAEDKIPIADMSIKLAEEATEDPGKWAAFRDFLAEKTGYEGFRSSKGAELQSAIKQYFLGDLSSIKGGRPNQLIERQLLDAYPRIGRDPISNQKILVGMKMQQEIQRKKVELTRDMEEKLLAKQGYLPPGFQSMIKRELKPFVNQIEKDTINKLSALSKYQNEYEKVASKQLKKGEVLMLSPEGSYEAIPKSNFDKAKEQGYIKLKG